MDFVPHSGLVVVLRKYLGRKYFPGLQTHVGRAIAFNVFTLSQSSSIAHVMLNNKLEFVWINIRPGRLLLCLHLARARSSTNMELL